MTTTHHLDRVARAERSGLDAARTRAVLDQEQRLVTEAILLVSRGGSRRVTVAGLQDPEEVIEASRPLAAASRVRLVPLWTDDERGADVAVEAIEAYATVDEQAPRAPVRPDSAIRAAARGA